VKNKKKVVLIVLLLSVLIMLVSCKKQGTEWKGTIEEVNGLTIVKNPKEPVYGDEVFSIEEELKIGEVEGDENYMFSQIRDIAVDKNENIYVADFKETHVKVFDKDGKYLRVFGKKGQGPGEIGMIYGIQITEKNELIVNDSNQRKISYFSLGGELIQSKEIRISPLRLYCDSKKNYYAVDFILEPPDSRYELLKYDGDMNLIATIAKTPAPDPLKPYIPFMPIFYCQVMNDDCLLYGYPESYELQIFNPEGKVIKKILRDYDPVPISEEEKEERRKDIRPGRKFEFARYHSAFYRFKVDDEGRIFVRTWEKPESGEGYFFDIFNPEGKYIAKIPLNIRPYVLKKGKIYTIEEDEDGYQFVKRYKTTWKY